MLRGLGGRRETSIGHTFRLCDKLVSKLVRSVAFPKTLYITNGNLMVRRYDDQGSLVQLALKRRYSPSLIPTIPSQCQLITK